MKELSVAIVTYNRKADVKLCLTSVFQQKANVDLEVIVYDNNSSDGVAQMIETEFPESILIKGKSNLGLGKPLNIALKRCTGRFVVLLDSDTIVQPNTFRLIIDFMKANPQVGAVTGRLLYPDGNIQYTARIFPTPLNILFGRQSALTRWFPNNPISRKYLNSEHSESKDPFEADWVSAACMMLRREVIEQVGGPDEDFFVYWIDAEYCRRIKKGGWKIFCVPQARIIHLEENKAGRKRNPKGIIDFHRGVYLYYTKHHATSPYNPMRLLALGFLASRAGALLFINALRKK